MRCVRDLIPSNAPRLPHGARHAVPRPRPLGSRPCWYSPPRKYGPRAIPTPAACICSNGRTSTLLLSFPRKREPSRARKSGPRLRGDDEFVAKWLRLRLLRSAITEQIEPLRRDKTIGSSLEADVVLDLDSSNEAAWDYQYATSVEMSEIAIVSKVTVTQNQGPPEPFRVHAATNARVEVRKTTNHKCGRCWRHLPEVSEDGDLCDRCEGVVNA